MGDVAFVSTGSAFADRGVREQRSNIITDSHQSDDIISLRTRIQVHIDVREYNRRRRNIHRAQIAAAHPSSHLKTLAVRLAIVKKGDTDRRFDRPLFCQEGESDS